MSAYDALNAVSVAQVVTTANAVSNVVPCETHNEAEAYIVASAVGGTTPSTTPSIESSPDGSNWFTHSMAGAAITANGNTLIKAVGNLGRFLRINYGAATGTTPTFTFNAWLHTKRVGA